MSKFRHSNKISFFRRLTKVENVFLIFWLVTGMFVAVLTPPGTGRDEEDHVARAEQIAEGYFFPETVDINDLDPRIHAIDKEYEDVAIYGGDTDEAIYELIANKYPSEYEDEIDKLHFSFPWWSDKRFYVEEDVGQSYVTWAFSNTAGNSPLCYLPHALGFLFGKLLLLDAVGVFILMRVFGVIVYGLLVRFAIKKLPVAKNAMMLIAFLPNCIAVNSMVTADMMTTAVCFVYFAYVFRFIVSYEKMKAQDFICLGISLFALALLKKPYIVFGLALVLIFFINKMWKNPHHVNNFFLIGLSSLVAFGTWTTLTADIMSYPIWGWTGIDQEAQIGYIFAYPFEALSTFMTELFSSDLGILSMSAYCTQSFPSWIVVLALSCVTMCDIKVCSYVKKPLTIFITMLVLSFIGAILCIAAVYITSTPVGQLSVNLFQSRYYVPLVFPVFSSFILLCTAQFKSIKSQTIYSIKYEYSLLSTNVSPLTLFFMFVFLLLTIRAFYVWLPFE